ncbi:pyridoxamine 5'-phosphate oxidase family protein [Nitratireductor basaltis]|uniref:FAD-binding FR-type domain-containing protein n=1 Tax=Nitratireductor basaltis TaxID=472175 RepID=A0A084U8M9_9HYPH|nr:pyridoxamine 5'-phosphate oxidase family protein [Nitratireductor basaltis]KFB09315.1 hypothetical protein EL18_00330 [Nitratireductor basaltis]
MLQLHSPFHAGELTAQKRAGVAQNAAQASRFIRDFMPEQHRAFFAALPFLIIAGADEAGRRWVSLIEMEEGDAASADPRCLFLPKGPGPDDPLGPGFTTGAELGVLGIELATRRRNRVNGRLRQDGGGFMLEVAQSFGNCPQYIRERELFRVEPTIGPAIRARRSRHLTAPQKEWISKSDTFFVGSGLVGTDGQGTSGFDASHRGGAPGFVEITGDGKLRFPDYAGNNFFNTIGNLLRDPRIGMLFVDFESGGLLHVTGRAEVLWDGNGSRDPQARREVVVTIEQVVERPGAISLRWHANKSHMRQLRIEAKVAETGEITSFYLASVDDTPLPSFLPGQHLPLELEIPGHATPVRRSYSLSGSTSQRHYRISVKREPTGLASVHMHDHLAIGDTVQAGSPSGDFLAPPGETPLVLVSAGVGVTPMMAMLHDLIRTGTSRPIFFVQGVRDGTLHPFRDEIAELASRATNLTLRTCISAPRPQDLPLPATAIKGHVSAEDLISLGAGPEAQFMICGPVGFVSSLTKGLEERGISTEQVHHETFGPAS